MAAEDITIDTNAGTCAGAADRISLDLDWPALTTVLRDVVVQVKIDGVPDVVVGVLRGGMIPAVLLAHQVGGRRVRAVEITHTATDAANAPKTAVPVLVNPGSLGDLAGLDVLIVDDVAGSGDTLVAAMELVTAARARRVRTAVCVVNELNWQPANDRAPHQTPSYVGIRCQGWVRFPWEK